MIDVDRWLGIMLILGICFLAGATRALSDVPCSDCRHEVERLTAENRALRAVCKRWPGRE